MKKKQILENKGEKKRVKTPDVNTIKKRNIKKKIADNLNIPITPQISANLQKNRNLKQSLNSSIQNESKISKKLKVKFASNKEKKEAQKAADTTTDIIEEERPKSVNKKSVKNKSGKKKELKKEEKKEEKKEIKKNNETKNKAGDNLNKPKISTKKTKESNNNNFDKKRRKSVDIVVNKNNKKDKDEKNNKNLDGKKISYKTTDIKKVKNRKKANKKENEKDIKRNIEVIQNAIIEDSKESDIIKPKTEIKKAKDNSGLLKQKNEIRKNIKNDIAKNENNKIKEEKKNIAKEEKKLENKKEVIKEEKKEDKKLENNQEQIKKEEIKEEKKNETKKDEKKQVQNLDKKENKPEESKQVKITNAKIKYIFMREKKFSSNYQECLYLGLSSGFFDPIQKLNLMIGSKELYNNLNKRQLISELINNYNKLSNKNLKKTNKLEYDIEKINSPFNPNERSINSLNFIDKEEENKLMNELQHPYITEYFKLILTLLNEKNDENKNIFEFFFKDLLEKHHASNIKNLLIKNFVNNTFIINDDQFNTIQKMILIKPDLLSPATLLRYNRAVAYSAFFMKDLFHYINLKTDDGKYYYQLRANLPKNEYQEKINKLRLLL